MEENYEAMILEFAFKISVKSVFLLFKTEALWDEEVKST